MLFNGGAILDADAIGGWSLAGFATAHGTAISLGAVEYSWVETAFQWSNLYLSIPLGFAGFWIAIVQIRQARTAAREAKSAADAAKDAADTAIANFKSRSIASLIPQLTHLEEMIGQAAGGRSTHFLSHAIHTWGWQAGMCRELLNKQDPAEKKTMAKIQRSTSAANQVRKDLLTADATTDWGSMTLRFRTAVLDVTSDLQALSAALVVKEPE